MHSQFGLRPNKFTESLSPAKKLRLTNAMRRSIVFIVDERSMIPSELLAACQRNMKDTIYNGVCDEHEFGGIPVILFFGDDYQLPPVVTNGRGKGAFYYFHEQSTSKSYGKTMLMEYEGLSLFQKMTSTVLKLSNRARQQDDQKMISLLDDIEDGNLNKNTINTLLELQLCKLPLEKQESIKRKSTYIFTTHEDKNKHNCMQLMKICSKNNPLACLKCNTCSYKGKFKRSHFNQSIPLKTHICVGARVAIKGKNIEPIWGLYNGTIGTVLEIVFANGKIPTMEIFHYMLQLNFFHTNHPIQYQYLTSQILKWYLYLWFH